MNDRPSDARERVLSAAERLFAERGYAAVTLRDIAESLGIRQASLYHHVPGGKDALFVEVTQRSLDRHRKGLEEAIAEAGNDLRAQFRAAARWLLAQPPMDLGRMMQSDMPALSSEHKAHADRLAGAAFESMLMPVSAALNRAYAQGRIKHADNGLISGSFISIIESIHLLPPHWLTRPKTEMADTMIDVLLDGLNVR